MKLEKISAAAFESEVLESDQLVVVDFYADWCGPCKRLLPELEAAADDFNGRVKFVKVNVDEEPEIGSRYGVQGIPNLTFFRGGKPVDVSLGAMPKAALSTKVSENLLTAVQAS